MRTCPDRVHAIHLGSVHRLSRITIQGRLRSKCYHSLSRNQLAPQYFTSRTPRDTADELHATTKPSNLLHLRSNKRCDTFRPLSPRRSFDLIIGIPSSKHNIRMWVPRKALFIFNAHNCMHCNHSLDLCNGYGNDPPVRADALYTLQSVRSRGTGRMSLMVGPAEDEVRVRCYRYGLGRPLLHTAGSAQSRRLVQWQVRGLLQAHMQSVWSCKLVVRRQ